MSGFLAICTVLGAGMLFIVAAVALIYLGVAAFQGFFAIAWRLAFERRYRIISNAEIEAARIIKAAKQASEASS